MSRLLQILVLQILLQIHSESLLQIHAAESYHCSAPSSAYHSVGETIDVHCQETHQLALPQTKVVATRHGHADMQDSDTT